MILFLLLLLAVLVVAGAYAFQNTGTHDVYLFNYHFSGVHDWLPVLAAAGAVALLMILYMFYAGAIHGVRRGALRRQVLSHEGTIGDLRNENGRLREENARLRSGLRQTAAPVGTGTPAGATASSTGPQTTGTLPAGAALAGDRETDVNRDGGMNRDSGTDPAVEPADRGRTAPAFRPQPSMGERIRSFFGGHETSGY